ncbi:hypothetical protein BB559_007455 [Furculomyces boomerangus]|uniref:Ubiquitin carboxyl-terminal hydrolase n=1 Tax=Furculomyces boomerangus TaxID=61424 RepID=A0A2T9XX72_9FUNG|nr:hypothetical protein BB559_007455 [Furculomyces boomerangus]
MNQDQPPQFLVSNLSVSKEYEELKKLFSKYPIYIPESSKDQWVSKIKEETSKEKPIQKKPPPSSWAALLRKDDPNPKKPTSNSVNKPSIESENATKTKSNKKKSLKELILNWEIRKNNVVFKPRGLVNTGNMCFMNVVLQSLVYCKYFSALLEEIRKTVSFSSNIPLLESLIMFSGEFAPVLNSLDFEDSDPSFVPEYVYNALREKKIFQTARGQQEDAQEFMGHLINGMHDELLLVIHQTEKNQNHNFVGFASPRKQDESYLDIDSVQNGVSEWLEIGKNSKASHKREVEFAQTPISMIFGGYLRSELKIPGSKPSATLEPFQCLALDISSEDVTDLYDALDFMSRQETIEGYTNNKGQTVTATKQVFLDSLPQVLIFILNRVVFSPDLGVHKLDKFVSYPYNLPILPSWISPNKRSQNIKTSYNLSSVLYHHGSSATGGHYTCDVERRENEWLRFDDTEISMNLEKDDVLDKKDDRSAYILIYTKK